MIKKTHKQHRKDQNVAVKKIVVKFYEDMEGLEKRFKASIERFEKKMVQLKEKIERSKENPDALLKGLKNV